MDKIYFTINGDRFTLSGSEVSPTTSLNDYLRNYLGLHGTKAMCHEGGCGACVVSVSMTHPGTKEKRVFAVNSCLVHILSCHQWDITTIEGIGNRKDGYHKLQTRLAAFNGTQCGYCTPGMVMNMYSLQNSTDKLSMHEVERSFGGNMCRCTGYRPIMDAFKSFAVDRDSRLKDRVQDLEELDKVKCRKNCERKCSEGDDWCIIEETNDRLMKLGGANRWYKAYTVDDVFKVLTKEGTDNYILAAGNTGKGVYPNTPEPRVYIDISSIETLRDTFTDGNLVLGAGMTLTDLMSTCLARAKANQEYSYLKLFWDHLELVAHVPVRNIGTIGGNLVLKNKHHDFPSDVFLLLETVQGCVTTVDNNKKETVTRAKDFVQMDLSNKLVINVKLPPLSSKNLIRTYKIMPRAQNAHAIVNAGFLFHLDKKNLIESSNIVFGNISPDFIHAKETENFIQGKDLFIDETLRKALEKLQQELVPEDNPPEPSPYCRKAIALGLFYKAVLSLSPSVNPRYKSGGEVLSRPIATGTQTYDTDKSLWPLNQPVEKLEGLSQCSGEARYCGDRHEAPRDVHVAFVLSTICVGEIVSFDPSEALKTPGVVGFFTAKDIPGRNTFTPIEVPLQAEDEVILPEKKVSYYGQPVALIAATTHKLAIRAAGLVKVKYNQSKQKPVLSIQDALKAPDKDKRIRQENSIAPTDKGTDIAHVIKGSYYVPDQYHFTMETQSCTVGNTRRGLVVRSATQWMDLVQSAVAKSLNLPLNSVTVEVTRIGGGYGAKAGRSSLIACACALVAHKLNRDATMVLPLTHNMAAIGKRQPCYAEYEIAVNAEGVIQYLNLSCYSDNGCSFNDTSASDLPSALSNLYDTSRWSIKTYSVLTDKASNTWARAPTTTEGTAVSEHLMERIAYTMKKDSLDIKMLHISSTNSSIKDMIDQFKMDTNYDDRRAEIAKFNSENAWTKKSLRVSLMAYPIIYYGNFPVTISVYHTDGTILISHGGIEMGQGINTKVAQVCAYSLKVPLEIVKVKGADSFVSPNAMASSGSITSESVAFATIKACDELSKRLEPVRQGLNEPTWEEVVQAAFVKGINLQVSATTSEESNLQPYPVYGVGSVEIVLDVLTGSHQISRVDIVEDTGQSISPALDVGQIEGAFIMGLGLWTSEKLIFSPTGQLLTDRTWTYKPPGVNDIPADFRITFKRNSFNNNGVLRSKTTGEPALVLAVVVTYALHEAICEARKEYGHVDTDWVQVDTPYCVENIIKGIDPSINYFKIK
ncbi:indole-3-acetaldehyde oxidase-like isoform X1 [Colias croceus]|uniref:indole-3-acetaldehyde oxidase-like isoform X1 n=2 Tax=Colias crocea TaxID=72248 RepID=UPI001E27C7A5|nr:indole-3-acetaldehyde oxidase-like isoform X1 [Colias croceus]